MRPEKRRRAAGHQPWRAACTSSPDGYLGQLGFRTGDKVIGIDGTEFADMFQLRAAFAGAMGKEEAVLTVERGGGRLEITINPRRMMERSDEMGGELEPASR